MYRCIMGIFYANTHNDTKSDYYSVTSTVRWKLTKNKLQNLEKYSHVFLDSKKKNMDES